MLTGDNFYLDLINSGVASFCFAFCPREIIPIGRDLTNSFSGRIAHNRRCLGPYGNTKPAFVSNKKLKRRVGSGRTKGYEKCTNKSLAPHKFPLIEFYQKNIQLKVICFVLLNKKKYGTVNGVNFSLCT